VTKTLRVLVPDEVTAKCFGRPRAHRAEGARSAPIAGRFATVSVARTCNPTACGTQVRAILADVDRPSNFGVVS